MIEAVRPDACSEAGRYGRSFRLRGRCRRTGEGDLFLPADLNTASL